MPIKQDQFRKQQVSIEEYNNRRIRAFYMEHPEEREKDMRERRAARVLTTFFLLMFVLSTCGLIFAITSVFPH